MVPSWQLVPFDKLSPTDAEIVCKAALDLWNGGGFDLLLVSGGVFLPPHTQTRPSAEIMRDWFVAQGIPSQRILTESRSLDTYQNIRESLTVLRCEGLESFEITVCTRWQHALRIWWTFKAAHGMEVSLFPITFPLPLLRGLREWLCLFYHVVDRDGGGPIAYFIRARRRPSA